MIIERFDVTLAHMDEFEPSTGHVLSSLYIPPADRTGYSKSHVKSSGFYVNALKIVVTFFASNRARSNEARVVDELCNLVMLGRGAELLRANEANFLMSLLTTEHNTILEDFITGICWLFDFVLIQC
jgi:hypothetical protein